MSEELKIEISTYFGDCESKVLHLFGLKPTARQKSVEPFIYKDKQVM